MTTVTGAGEEIAAVVDRLVRLRTPIEETFLAAGSGLAEAMESMRSISGTFAGLSRSLDSDRLGRSIASLGEVTDGLAAAAAASSGAGEALRRLDASAQRLGAPLGRLRKTVDEVQVLAVNARIEAAQVTSAHTDFSVFTTEMGRLAELARGALDRLAAELAGLLEVTGAAQAGQLSFDRQQGAALDEVARHIGGSVAQLAARRQSAAVTASRIEEASRRTGGRVGEAIAALQIGDITRQRIEHVEEALAAVGTDAARGGAVCRLQALQLGETQQDFRREADRVAALLGAVAGEAEAVGRAGQSPADSALLDNLGGELRTALDLASRCRTAGEGLQQLLAPVSRRVAQMATHVETVRSIEADMRIMGLNATLKCGRLGAQGRALGVIAGALRGHAGRTAEDARLVMDGLGATAAEADRLAAGRSAIADSLLATLAEAAQSFDEVGKGLAEAHGTLGRKAAQACTRLREAASRFASAAGMAAGLSDCATRLDRTATALGAPQGAEGVLAAHPQLEMSYTMDSERQVHARFTGATAPAATVAPELDDIFF